MGCGSSKIETISTPQRVTEQLGELPEYQLSELKDGKDLKIFSAMLVNEHVGDVLDYYKPVETLGQGSFGKVFKVIHIPTKKIYAMKVVSKYACCGVEDKNFLREILILRKLDHPNILKVYEYFSNEKYYYFIMEYVSGGELYEQIFKMPNYNERLASIIMKQVFSSISYLHLMNIVHRDLKPENIMLTSKSDMSIKLVDFGAANYVNPTEPLKLKIGSAYYIAPEVLKGNYGIQCDLWSCGVILYILLVGYPPFDGEDNDSILKKVIRGKYSLTSEGWDNISKQAKDLVEKLLEINPQKRITAEETLRHPWILRYSTSPNNDSTERTQKLSLKASLYNCDSNQKLHQAAVAYIVHRMENNSMISQLTSIFKAMDKSGEGLLSLEELKEGYHQFFSDNLTDEEFNEIMKKIDQDNSGQISIEEFLRATVDYQLVVTDNNLKVAFDSFDKDHSGLLSPDEIKDVLGIKDVNESTQKIIEDIIKDVDTNGDGQVSFEEFKVMMQKGFVAPKKEM